MAAHFHHVPGRLRVRVASVKGNAVHAKTISDKLSQLPGVRRVETRELTGSIVIHYDPVVTSVSTLTAHLEIEKLENPAGSSLAPIIARHAAKTILNFVIEKAAERAILLVLAVFF